MADTALHEVVRIDSPRIDGADVANLLLQRGANPCLRNNIGQTPLDMAVNLGRGLRLRNLLQ